MIIASAEEISFGALKRPQDTHLLKLKMHGAHHHGPIAIISDHSPSARFVFLQIRFPCLSIPKLKYSVEQKTKLALTRVIKSQ